MKPVFQMGVAVGLRAAWRLGWEVSPGGADARRGFDLRVFESGEPFCLAFQGRPSNPTASGTLDGVLRQMLSPWPRNFNPPLTIIHLGRVLDDRDGTADLLKQRAEQLWDLGAPPPDSRQLRWLAWSARRAAVAVECCASEAAQDTPLLNFLAAEALDRCIVAYCQAQDLWAAPFPEFLSLGGEAKYSEIVAAAKSFFHADSAAARQAVLFQVVELMRAAIARHLPAGV